MGPILFRRLLFLIKNHNIPQKQFEHSKQSKHSKKSLNKTPFYGSAYPREGNPPGKHIFLNAFQRKNVILGLQTAFFDGFNVILSSLAENDTERL